MIEMIEIYLDDLIPAKRAEILEKMGEDCNWDVFPLAVIEVVEEDM